MQDLPAHEYQRVSFSREIMTRKNARRLRSGFTTGTAAAASALAAAGLLLQGTCPGQVRVRLLTGDCLDIAVHACGMDCKDFAWCSVIKDAGDDPDVTNKAEIGARVSRLENTDEITICAGKGVGRITKPGLELAPGEPAINPGPRRMIRESLEKVLQEMGGKHGLRVEVFVPRGEEIALRTLNHRLGITGGISILGTTGVVRPMSHAAYIATIDSALSVARACDLDRVVCTTGRRSERFAQGVFSELAEEGFVQIGDYFAESMKRAARKGHKEVVLVVFFGKAVKMAQGSPHTHAARSRLALEELAIRVQKQGGGAELEERVAKANTAREAFFMLQDECPEIFEWVVQGMTDHAQSFAGSRINVRAILLDYEGRVTADSSGAWKQMSTRETA